MICKKLCGLFTVTEAVKKKSFHRLTLICVSRGIDLIMLINEKLLAGINRAMIM